MISIITELVIESSERAQCLSFTGKSYAPKDGLRSPCDMIELTTSWNFSSCRRVEKVCADRQLFRNS